jgi:hypothetical protein
MKTVWTDDGAKLEVDVSLLLSLIIKLPKLSLTLLLVVVATPPKKEFSLPEERTGERETNRCPP